MVYIKRTLPCDSIEARDCFFIRRSRNEFTLYFLSAGMLNDFGGWQSGQRRTDRTRGDCDRLHLIEVLVMTEKLQIERNFPMQAIFERDGFTRIFEHHEGTNKMFTTILKPH